MNKKKTLNIGYLSTLYHTSFILMSSGRLEEELDLTVQWNMFGGGPAIVDAFSKRDVDIGYIGLPPVMIGIDKCVPIKCIGGGHVEGTVMIGIPGSRSFDDMGTNIRAVLEQFMGGTIGCPPSGSIHDVIINDLLKKYGLEDNITVKNYSWADFIPDALADGELNAAVGTPPLSVAAARACSAKVIIPPSKLWPWNPSYGIIVSQELLLNQPELIEVFLQFHEDASNLIRHDPRSAARMVAEMVEVVDSDFIMQTYQISPKYCADLPDKYIESAMAFIPVLRDLGYINSMLTEADIFNTSLIDRIHLSKHHYTG